MTASVPAQPAADNAPDSAPRPDQRPDQRTRDDAAPHMAEDGEVTATVVIPTRGGRKVLHLPLDSLAAQDRTDFEVVVVVDGDVDGTAQALAARAPEQNPPRLQVVVLPENRGRAAALNAGFSRARGRILIRCDDDLRVRPDFVEQHVRAHGGRELSAAVGLTTNVFGPPEQASGYARVYGIPADRLFRAEAAATAPQRQWRYWAANCSATRSAHRALGGYDPDYRRYGWEDVDFGYRLHRLGAAPRIVPELLAEHHGPARSTRQRALRALHSGAAREMFLAKHGPQALGPVGRPGGAWGLLVRATAAVMTEPVVRAAAAVADRAAARLPAPVARKMVALCVEAAARSGILHPRRARGTF